MSVLSDKLQDVFMNIHNKFVDVNSRTDELFDAKADRSELPTKVSQLENDTNYVTNTDYATADVGGVVKVGQYQKGLYVIPDTKQLSIYGAEKNDVETKTTSPRPILPYRVDYAVSKSTHQTMADEYDTTTMYVNDTSMVGAQGQLPASYDAVKTYVDDGLTSKADKEVWEKLVDVTLTENLTDEFRQVFDKPYKKIRFKIKFVGDSTMTLTQVRFKRCKTDGNNSHYNYNYLKYTSGSNLSAARIIAGTVEFDIDNFIVIKNSSITTSSSVFGTNGDTYRSDGFYSEEMQTFPEFYMYLGTNVIGVGSKIEVWGCN